MSHPPTRWQVEKSESLNVSYLGLEPRVEISALAGAVGGAAPTLPRSRLLLCDLGAVSCPPWACSSIHMYNEGVGL